MFDLFRRKKQQNPAAEEAAPGEFQHTNHTAGGDAGAAQSVEDMLAALENVFAKEAAQRAEAAPAAEGISVEHIENQSVEDEVSAEQTQTETLTDDIQPRVEAAADMPSENIAAQVEIAADASVEDENTQEIVLTDDGKVVIDYVQVTEGTEVVSVTPEQAVAAAAPSPDTAGQAPATAEAAAPAWDSVFPDPDQPAEAEPAPTDDSQKNLENESVHPDSDVQAMPSENIPAAAAAAPLLPQEEDGHGKSSWASRLKQGLAKSRDKMAKSLAGVFGGGKIDEDLYEELETVLITGDMGMEATNYLMKDVRNRVSLKGLKDGAELRGALKEAVYDLIKPLEQPLVLPESKEPFVIMLAGINGAGKTTSIGKLAKYFQSQGKSVLLAAGDTFRAAAREQLQQWGERNNVTVISQSTGDSAAVCFDAVQAAKARGIDIVLADTAGRLPTQLHLMEEIKKVKRVLQKAMPDAPHEIILVLDANIGQNAVNQVKAFDEALGLTGLIVTKLDGTAKGGILAALACDRPIPVRYIGVGERIDDLRPFDARAFVDALLD